MIYISGATKIGGQSDKENNQDDYGIWTEESLISRKEIMETEMAIADKTVYFAVADGVSCIRKPEESSKMVIDACLEASKKTKEMPVIMDEVNLALSNKNKKYNPNYASTVTFGYIQDQVLEVSNIGDSPLYVYDGNNMNRITDSQTLAALKKKEGFEEDEIYEKDYHTLIHYAGEKKEGSKISSTSIYKLNEGEVIFLFSDGIDKEKATDYYKNHPNCLAKDIVENQNDACEDNLTLIIIKIKD